LWHSLKNVQLSTKGDDRLGGQTTGLQRVIHAVGPLSIHTVRVPGLAGLVESSRFKSCHGCRVARICIRCQLPTIQHIEEIQDQCIQCLGHQTLPPVIGVQEKPNLVFVANPGTANDPSVVFDNEIGQDGV
jgi:hypothetical protein